MEFSFKRLEKEVGPSLLNAFPNSACDYTCPGQHIIWRCLLCPTAAVFPLSIVPGCSSSGKAATEGVALWSSISTDIWTAH